MDIRNSNVTERFPSLNASGMACYSVLILVHYCFCYTLMTYRTHKIVTLKFFIDDANAFCSHVSLSKLKNVISGERTLVVKWFGTNRLHVSLDVKSLISKYFRLIRKHFRPTKGNTWCK